MNLKINILVLTLILIFTTTTLAKETDEPVVNNLIIDRKTISYELTQPAIVRIRVGSKSGPLYRTLVSWQKQKKGRHTLKWDGLDTSKTFNILDNKNFTPLENFMEHKGNSLTGFTFSFNYYLPHKDEPMMSFIPQESSYIVTDNFIGRATKFTHLSQLHKTHKKEHCKDIEVLFELPKTKKGIARIKEATPITIKVSTKDKLWFTQERFSINIFIDDIFVKGEALGYNNYTWNFNPQGINKGKHLITVNLKGFDDHIGIGSLPIYIE